MSQKKTEQIKQQILHEAASMLAEGSVLDIGHAKRKAAQRFGVKPGPQSAKFMPRDEEIEFATSLQQRLFQQEQPSDLHRLRRHALEIMQRFEQFQPKLAGSILSGTAGPHQPIELHLYAATSESVAIELMQQQIPYEIRNLKRQINNEELVIPSYEFMAGDDEVHLEVYPDNGLRLPPLHGGKRVKQAGIKQLQDLIDSETI